MEVKFSDVNFNAKSAKFFEIIENILSSQSRKTQRSLYGFFTNLKI